MSLEFDLLAHCCGLARGIPTLTDMSASGVPAGLEEDRFIALARQHKVSGTAYAGLGKAGIELSPEGMRILAREARVSRATHSLLLRDWLEIVAAFKSKNIRALTIKGPASSIQLYGDPLTREFGDLDLLVDITDIDSILPLMAGTGYAPVDASALRPTSANGPLMQKSHHVVFGKAGRPFHIEIHGKTWQEDKQLYPVQTDELFERAVALGDGAEWGDSLDLADHTLFIIAHGTRHAWCLLHWLLDMAALLNRDDDDLHRKVALGIQAMGMERQLKLACAVVQSVYPVTIPAPLQEIITGEKASLARATRFALARLQVGGRDMATLRNILESSLMYLPAFVKKPTHKIKLFFRPFLTPQIDTETLHLPKPLYFLYVPLRPFFVLSRRLKRRFGHGASYAN
ncbi:MAG: nucleotidyltransferase family protein [Rectinemataceae bacterium]|nr:nucleotidyltransferase family protein [Rectinemataceae bacterium]